MTGRTGPSVWTPQVHFVPPASLASAQGDPCHRHSHLFCHHQPSQPLSLLRDEGRASGQPSRQADCTHLRPDPQRHWLILPAALGACDLAPSGAVCVGGVGSCRESTGNQVTRPVRLGLAKLLADACLSPLFLALTVLSTLVPHTAYLEDALRDGATGCFSCEAVASQATHRLAFFLPLFSSPLTFAAPGKATMQPSLRLYAGNLG